MLQLSAHSCCRAAVARPCNSSSSSSSGSRVSGPSCFSAWTSSVMNSMRASSSSGKRSRSQAASATVQSEQTCVSQPEVSLGGGGGGGSRQAAAAALAQAHIQLKQAMPSAAAAAPAAEVDMTASDSDSDSGPLRVPLKLVVQDAVKRWFNETQLEARRGDVKQQALLAQMLAEGYGCKADADEAARWAERARTRGYTMSGVYCEL